MPTNKKVNVLFLVTVVIYLGLSLLVSHLPFIQLNVVGSVLLAQAFIIGPSLIYCLVKKISIKELIPFKKIKFSAAVLVVVCTCLMQPLLIVLNALTLFFVESGTQQLSDISSYGNIFMATLLIAVLPAFVEEFIFRGVLFQTYRKSKMLWAMFLSAFLFGCMHLNFNQFLYAFVLGVYMAFLVEATGSIFSSMLAHFTVNFTSVVLLYALPILQEKMTELQGITGGMETLAPATGKFLENMDETALVMMGIGIMFWGAIAIGTTAGAIAIVIAISKISNRWDHLKTMFKGGSRERLITIPLVLAMVILIGFMIWSAI